MEFVELLNETAAEARRTRAKQIANELSGKIIEAADTGLFRIEVALEQGTADQEEWNKLVISKEFTQLLELELEGVRVTGELRQRNDFLNIMRRGYYLIFEWS